MKKFYFVEMTDTFGGEANYCWVNRFKVRASSARGAILMVARETGHSGRIRKTESYSREETRHDVHGATICYFTRPWDKWDENYSRIVNLGFDVPASPS